MYFLCSEKIDHQAHLTGGCPSAIHNSTSIMNTIIESDRIEVVVHRTPEAIPKTPQWLLDLAGRSPIQSPLPIQYDFTEPVKLSLGQWFLSLLKRL